jgi:hypothetical protein
MKLSELFETITAKKDRSRLPGTYNLKLYDGKIEIGQATFYKDTYAGNNDALNLQFFMIHEKYRGRGFAEQGLQAVKQYMLKVDPSARFILAEPMSQKILHLNEKVFGKPIYVSDDIREYSLEDAYELLPVDANENLSGRKIYTVYKLKR